MSCGFLFARHLLVLFVRSSLVPPSLLFLFKLNEILVCCNLETRFMRGATRCGESAREIRSWWWWWRRKNNRIHFFFVFFGFFFSYNKPENEPGTRKKNVNEARDVEKKKEHHEVKKEYLKTGFFGEWFQSNWIQLRGAQRENGHSISMVEKYYIFFPRVSRNCFFVRVLLIFGRKSLYFLGRRITSGSAG